MLRIGVVDYLNAYPLWAALEQTGVSNMEPGRRAHIAREIHSNKDRASNDAASAVEFDSSVELLRGVPSFLVDELLSGRLDAALISSVEYLRHREGFSFHPDLCIAATREVKSIRLFLHTLREPFASQLKTMRKIYTDISSRSSVAQLQMMLAELKLTVPLEEIADAGKHITELREGEALLAIGDTALTHMAEPSYDLQREYFRIFGHGFVYALWVFRASLSAVIIPVLSRAFDAYQADVSRYLRQATERFGFSADFTKAYLTETILHGLSAERRADLEFFAAQQHLAV